MLGRRGEILEEGRAEIWGNVYVELRGNVKDSDTCERSRKLVFLGYDDVGF